MIQQPAFPVTASDFMEHIGGYVDAQVAAVLAGSVGAAYYSGGWPARPSGFGTVLWIGPAMTMTGMVAGDLFIAT